jgi:hypothetical protein
LNDGDIVQVGQHEILYIDERMPRMRSAGDTVETELPEKPDPTNSAVRPS